MDDVLSHLAKRVQVPDGLIVTADEASDWPKEVLDDFVCRGILKEIEPARTIICDECSRNCSIEPDHRTNPKTGEAIGVFVCRDVPEVGRMEINLERLRQWKIDRGALRKLGYGKKQCDKERKPVSRRAKAKSGYHALLVGALMAHHRFESDEPNWYPITQKELASQLTWHQSRVSRELAGLFGEQPMRSYKRACSGQTILGFLKKNEDGTYEPEAGGFRTAYPTEKELDHRQND